MTDTDAKIMREAGGEDMSYDEFVKRFVGHLVKCAAQPVNPELYAYGVQEAAFYYNYRHSGTPEELAWDMISIGDEG